MFIYFLIIFFYLRICLETYIEISPLHTFITKKEKLPTRQIHWKHPKSIDKLIVCKFIDGFLSLSVITDRFPTDF